MGQTKNFFNEKKSWSIVKDKILGNYLTPYTSKVLKTGSPIVICDCFAGKGKFDDGENGSPLIIAEHIRNMTAIQSAGTNKISGICIEKKYYNDLTRNLTEYASVSVRPGTFEENLPHILALDTNTNLFLYVDPYGIKSLNFALFSKIKNKRFSSLEMLMNFNSAGFLREGCRLLKYEGLIPDDEVTDYEVDDDANTVDNMNTVAGGKYWQDILSDYYAGQSSIHEAEEHFFGEYSHKVNQLFKYTVNIPIKLKSTHLPKYRLIFGSDHEDGLILMADNMNKKWNEIVDMHRNGQQVLFEYEFPDLSQQKGFNLQNDISDLVSAKPSGIFLKDLIVALIQKYGITFSEKQYKDVILELDGKRWRVNRVPPVTIKTGKPTTSMDYKRYSITVKSL